MVYGILQFTNLAHESHSEETVLSDDIDIEAVNGGFPMSDVIEIQMTDAIHVSD